MQRAVRTGLLLLALALLGVAVSALAVPAVTTLGAASGEAGDPVTFPMLVLAGCAVAATLAWLWLLVAVASVLVDCRLPVRCPQPLRLLVLALVGVSAVAVPAQAAPAPPPDPAGGRAALSGVAAPSGLTPGSSVPTGLTGLPVPDRPLTTVPASASTSSASAGARDGTPPQRPAPSPRVRVDPGDSLWSIAAQRLPPGASAGDLDRAWRQIARLNRPRLPDGPHLLVPGQQLRLPDTLPPSGKDSR